MGRLQRPQRRSWPKLEQGRLDNVEYQLVTKDGNALDVLMSGRVEHGPGRELHILGGIMHITARRKAEEALCST